MRRTFAFLKSLIAATTVLTLLAARPVNGQQSAPGPYTVKVVQVDTSQFPIIGVWVSVLDAQGNPVTTIPDSGFTLTENGQTVKVTDVSHSGQGQAGSV